MGIDFNSLTEATSGAVGGLLSTTLIYPLDTCKSKYQVESADSKSRKYNSALDVLKEAIRANQLGSLYQGLATKNLQSIISQFIYFYSYSYFKYLYLARSRKASMGTAVNLVVAAAAGAVTSVVTQPLDTASAKMQTSKFGESKGLLATLRSGNWTGAFDGLGASLVLTSNPAIQYTVFEQLKNRMLHRRSLKNQSGSAVSGSSPATLSMFTAFLLGAWSKTVATVLTYPAIRCKVMIQAGENQPSSQNPSQPSPLPPKTMVMAMRIIWKTEGLLGFYKGLDAQIMKTVLSAAVMLAIKEKTAETTMLAMLALRRWSLSGHQTVAKLLPKSKVPRLATTALTPPVVLKKTF